MVPIVIADGGLESLERAGYVAPRPMDPAAGSFRLGGSYTSTCRDRGPPPARSQDRVDAVIRARRLS